MAICKRRSRRSANVAGAASNFRREGADLGEGELGLLLVEPGGDDARVLDLSVGADAAVLGVT